MAQFYTLEEAARVLGMSPEELKAKAQHREVRAFLDGGSWRFRVADVDELARRRGLGSDAELRLSDLEVPAAPAGEDPKTSTSPSSSSASPSPTSAAETMDFGTARRPAGLGLRVRSRHPARRPLAAPQPGDRLELGDHRHAVHAASCRATPTSGSSPTTSRGPSDSDVRLASPDPDFKAAERLRRDPDQRRHRPTTAS